MKEKHIRFFKAISADEVDKVVSTPIHIAGQSYTPKYPIPNTYKQFQEDCGMCHTHIHTQFYQMTKPHPYNFSLSKVQDMIENAFSNNGGMRFGFFTAQNQTFSAVQKIIVGGIIKDATQVYLGHILTTYVNPYDRKELKILVEDYIEYFSLNIKGYDIEIMISEYKSVFYSHLHFDREIRDANFKLTRY